MKMSLPASKKQVAKTNKPVVNATRRVEVLEGLEKIRVKPGMYVGHEEGRPFLLVREIIDNAFDSPVKSTKEIIINVIISNDKTKIKFIVEDRGDGIPDHSVNVAGKKKSSLWTVVNTVHAGTKLSSSSSVSERGTHGVGMSCTAALASFFEIKTVASNNSVRTLTVKDGVSSEETRTKERFKGTKVTFELVSGKYFVINAGVVSDLIKSILLYVEESTSFSNRPSSVEIKSGKQSLKKAYSIFGIIELQKSRGMFNNNETCFFYKAPQLTVAVDFANVEVEKSVEFLNYVPTEGFVKTVRDIIFASLKSFYKRPLKFTSIDIRMASTLISVLHKDVNWDNQAKTKVSDKNVLKWVKESDLKLALIAFFKKNRNLLTKVCKTAESEKAIKSSHKRELAELRNFKKENKQTEGGGLRGMPINFVEVVKVRGVNERETYIVEGDSAGGTAKKARDNTFQEILPVKGKILNVARKAPLSNPEVQDLLRVMGWGGEPRGRLVLLSDPDPDGYHINCLLLTLVAKMVPHYLDQGRVFAVKAPKYLCKVKSNIKYVFGDTVPEIESLGGTANNLQYIKGWGQISVEAMKMIAFSPLQRKLIQITRDNIHQFIELMSEEGIGERKDILLSGTVVVDDI